MRLKANLAVSIPGAAQLDGTTLRLPSAMGPFVHGLVGAVDRLDVVAYDPPAVAVENRDRVDYEVEVPPTVRVVSLGAKGSLRDYAARQRRVAAIVKDASRDWDVTVYRLRNRRLQAVASANRCPRIVGYIGGFTATVVSQTDLPPWRKLLALTSARMAERDVQRTARAAGLFFANGEELVERYRAAGVDTELLRTSSTFESDFFASDDRFESDEITVALAGRITAAKGVFDALDAFEAARRRLDRPARLLVIGDGDAVGELQRRCRERGLEAAVEFRGWQPAGAKLLAQLREADVLLHLSRAESMPKMVWEAMSQSVPVVATPVGSLPRVFADGRELLFAGVGDSEAAADAIVRLAIDGELRARVMTAAWRRVQGISVEAITGELLGRIRERWPELHS